MHLQILAALIVFFALSLVAGVICHRMVQRHHRIKRLTREMEADAIRQFLS